MTLSPPRHTAGRAPRAGLRALAIVASLVLGVALPSSAFAWDANSFSASDEQLLVTLTNQSRASAGLPALQVDAVLADIARWRSKDMIDRDYFSHSIPPAGGKVFGILEAEEYCFTLAGENIGWNTHSDGVATEWIHQAFLDSPGHRTNIVAVPWNAIGVGAYKGPDGTKVWTVLFADRCDVARLPPGA